MKRIAALTGCCLILSVGTVPAAEPVDFVQDVKPILKQRCFACHGALKQESGLRLDAASLIQKGGESGAAIKPGNAANSLLLYRVAAEDSDIRMPPEGEGERLTPAQLDLVRTWIDAGANAPQDEVIPTDPAEHWAYQTVQRPPLPQVDDPRWSQPIDAFVYDKHQQLGLQAVETADRHTLLRRV